MKLYIATHNMHKLREFKAMLQSILPCDIYSLRDLPSYTPKEEIGKSFQENADAKAIDASLHTDEYVLADDSGLVVPSLNGEPGIHSARFCGEDSSDKNNRILLIKKLLELDEPDRTGYFACALSLARKGVVIKSTFGKCEGTLLTKERGGNGFGYDPIFLKYEYSKTFSELDEDLKNKISHRRKALDKLFSNVDEFNEKPE